MLIPFTNVDELQVIKPKDGGGPSFGCVLEHMQKEMSDMEISSIIVLADGYAAFPDESGAMGIPVLWMVNNEDVTPPWGKVARIE